LLAGFFAAGFFAAGFFAAGFFAEAFFAAAFFAGLPLLFAAFAGCADLAGFAFFAAVVGAEAPLPALVDFFAAGADAEPRGDLPAEAAFFAGALPARAGCADFPGFTFFAA
jgi:hypothetical protein